MRQQPRRRRVHSGNRPRRAAYSLTTRRHNPTVRDLAGWIIDALAIGAGAGLLYWGLRGGGFPWFYAIVIGVGTATYSVWRQFQTPGRSLLVHRFGNTSLEALPRSLRGHSGTLAHASALRLELADLPRRKLGLGGCRCPGTTATVRERTSRRRANGRRSRSCGWTGAVWRRMI